jgi:hypothetical protein
MMKRHILIFLFVGAFLLLGCIYDDKSEGMQRFVDEMIDQPYELKLGEWLEPCNSSPCRMFACGFTNSPWKNGWFEENPYGKYPSLVGGACADALCNMSTLEKLYMELEASEETGYVLKPNIFSVGMGPGYWEFEYGNAFANSSLRSITIFLTGRAKHYPLPDPRLATCYLDKGVLPIYVFYAEDGDADFEAMNRSMEKAAELMEHTFDRVYVKEGLFGDKEEKIGPVGPIIFVTDPHLNLTNEDVRNNASILIKKIENTCPHCMVAVGIEFNNSRENYELVGNNTIWYDLFYGPRFEVKDGNAGVREGVIGGDRPLLLAIGLDSRNFDDCDVKKMYWELMNFTSYALKEERDEWGTIKKGRVLTIIPYVYFGKGKRCEITREEASDGFALLFTTAPSFPYYGILSINIYQPITSYFDPLATLKEQNNNFPLPPNPNFADATNIKTSYEPMHNAFFGFARAYYTGAGKYEQALPSVPLVFSYGCNATCGMAANFNILRYENFSSGRVDIFEEFKGYEPSEPIYSCLFNYIDKLPDDYSLNEESNADCTTYYPILESIADRFGIAPSLLRAVVQVESGFNEQQVIYQPMSASCNPDNLNLSQLFPGKFPSEEKYYVDDRFINDSISPCRPESTFKTGEDKKHKGKECKPCAFGLTAREYLPTRAYIEHNREVPEAVQYCDLDGNGFDPLDPAENLCAYAYDFNKALWEENGAWGEIREMEEELKINDSETSKYFNYVEWLALFRALDKSHRWQGKAGQHEPCHLKGKEECGFKEWVDAFKEEDENDFFKFVKNDVHKNEKSFAYDILATFLSTRKTCSYAPTFSEKEIDENMIYIPYKEYQQPKKQ